MTGARAARRVSSFDLGPTITAIGSATRQRSSIAQMPGLTSQLPQQNLYDVGFDASWELDVFGRVNRTVNAYSTLAASAEHGLEDVQVTLAAEVARTYFELRGAEQQLAVARRNAENQRRTVSLTEDRLAAGSWHGVRHGAREVGAAADARGDSERSSRRSRRIGTGSPRSSGARRTRCRADWLGVGDAADAAGHGAHRLAGAARAASARCARRRASVGGAVAVRRRGAGGVPAADLARGERGLRGDELRFAQPARDVADRRWSGDHVPVARPRSSEGAAWMSRMRARTKRRRSTTLRC